MASTRCAISAFSTSIWPSAVGVVGPVKITSASSSFAASSAPLCTASKKPLPSDLATMPMRVRCGFCRRIGLFWPQPAQARGQYRARRPQRQSSSIIDLLPSNRRAHAIFFNLVFRRDLRDDHLDARGLEFFELFRLRAVVGDDGGDAIQARHDHRRLAAQLGAVRHHDDVLAALQQLGLRLHDERIGFHHAEAVQAVAADEQLVAPEALDGVVLERREHDVLFAEDRAARQRDAIAAGGEQLGRDRKRVGQDVEVGVLRGTRPARRWSCRR